MRLVSERGFHGVTIQEIADECGIAKQGVLHHFPSKLTLLVSLLADLDERDLTADAAASLAGISRNEARLLLDRIILRSFERREITRLLIVLGAEAMDPAHPAHVFFAQRLANSRRALVLGAQSWHPDPESAVLTLIAFVDGLQYLWLRDEDLPVRALWSAFADQLFLASSEGTPGASPPPR